MATIRYEKSPTPEHPIHGLMKEMPWLLAPGDIDAETMKMIGKIVWRKAIEAAAGETRSG